MSIYSGFGTRNQQAYYDKIIYSVISTLIVRLMKFYSNESVDEEKFEKIISKQQKILKKMQKRKYLEPKYSHLLQEFLYSIPNQTQKHSLPQSYRQKLQMNRTLSLIDRQMHQLRQQAEKYIVMDQQPSKTLDRIQQLPKPHKKYRSKSKKNSMKSYVDLWELRHQKLPSIPSMNPVEYSMITKNNFHSKNQSVGDVQDPISQKDPSSVGKKTFFNKPLNFRANMFVRK